MCEISIIVPVYNMASDGKLEYGINSLLNQTLTDYEIIAVDDKSTDNSLEILREFEKKYPGKVRVLESEKNGRQGAARNKGVKIAKGEYIGFMDADDWVLPDTFESALKKARETGADVVGFDMCAVYEHTMIPTEHILCNTMDQTGIVDDEKRAKFILKLGPVSNKIYKKEFFSNPPFAFPEGIAYEDNAMIIERIMRMKHFEHIPEPKTFYYQREGSTTHNTSLNNICDRMAAMRIFLDSARNWNILDKFHEEIEFTFCTIFYSTTLFSYMQSDIKHSVKFIKQLSDETKEAFPDFMNNPLFQKALDEEQMKFVKLQQRSTLAFYLYYNFKKIYRKIRYGKW